MCNIEFSSRELLQTHIATPHVFSSQLTEDVHEEEKAVTCSICKINFVNTPNLKKHMEQAHFRKSDDVITVMFKKSKN